MLSLLLALLLGQAVASPSAPAPTAPAAAPPAPDWVRRPSAADFMTYYPSRARSADVEGRATVACRVTASGALTSCRVVSESPAGWGFGAAALALTPQFQMRSTDGRSIDGAEITIPIRFSTGEGPGPSRSVGLTGPDVRVLTEPVWAEAPSRAEVAAARPGSGEGYAVMRCRARDDGRLRRCDVVTESPRRGGFGDAALRLSGRFRLAPAAEGTSALAGAQMDVRVSFGPEPPAYHARPQWLRGPTAQEMQAALAPLAQGAPDRTASAAVDCRIGAGGVLEECRVARAAPEGAGAAALGLAPRFVVVPWTPEGAPVVGARIRLPLRYVAD